MGFCQTRVLVCPKVLPPDCGGKESGEHKDQTRATVNTAACQHGQSCDTKSVDATVAFTVNLESRWLDIHLLFILNRIQGRIESNPRSNRIESLSNRINIESNLYRIE